MEQALELAAYLGEQFLSEQCQVLYTLGSIFGLAAVVFLRLGRRLHARRRARRLKGRLDYERRAILRALDGFEGSATAQLDSLERHLREGPDDARP